MATLTWKTSPASLPASRGNGSVSMGAFCNFKKAECTPSFTQARTADTMTGDTRLPADRMHTWACESLPAARI
jgi:hypothetical protein